MKKKFFGILLAVLITVSLAACSKTVEKRELSILIGECQNLNAAIYTEESFNKLAQQLKEAIKIFNNLDSSQKEIDAVTGELRETKNGLVTVDFVVEWFTNSYSRILLLNADTVTISDRTDIEQAILIYDGMDSGAQKRLSVNKSKLDALKIKIDYLEGEKALSDAKNLKISKIPSLATLIKTEYTIASWSAVEKDIADDKNAIESCTTLAAVNEYVIKTKLNKLVTVKSVTTLFINQYGEALGLTVDTVNRADEENVNGALDAYDMLADDIKDKLTAEKALLDRLMARINEITAALVAAKKLKLDDVPDIYGYSETDYTAASWSIFKTATENDTAQINSFEFIEQVEEYTVLADAGVLVAVAWVKENFCNMHSDILGKNTDNISKGDRLAVESALSDYDLCSKLEPRVQEALQQQKNLLDNLILKIIEIEFNEAKQYKLNLVPAFAGYDEEDYTCASWSVFKTAIEADLEAINSFTNIEQLLSYNVVTNVNMLITLVSAAKEYRDYHFRVFDKTVDSIDVTFLDEVMNALLDYDLLEDGVKALLPDEKELLDALAVIVTELDADAKLQSAKALKKESIPSMDGLSESNYTATSWLEVSQAIRDDLRNIDECISVEQVDLYELTTNLSGLKLLTDAIEEFKNRYSAVLSKTVDNVEESDRAQLELALSEYNGLKDLEPKLFELLDEYKMHIEAMLSSLS